MKAVVPELVPTWTVPLEPVALRVLAPERFKPASTSKVPDAAVRVVPPVLVMVTPLPPPVILSPPVLLVALTVPAASEWLRARVPVVRAMLLGLTTLEPFSPSVRLELAAMVRVLASGVLRAMLDATIVPAVRLLPDEVTLKAGLLLAPAVPLTDPLREF